jgi:hypothetical protein
MLKMGPPRQYFLQQHLMLRTNHERDEVAVRALLHSTKRRFTARKTFARKQFLRPFSRRLWFGRRTFESRAKFPGMQYQSLCPGP